MTLARVVAERSIRIVVENLDNGAKCRIIHVWEIGHRYRN